MQLAPELHDFRNFLYSAWHRLGLPDPTRLQYDVAHQMQCGPDRLVILGFRGFGKSWICSARGDHTIALDLARQFLNTSASKKKSDDATRFMLNLIKIMPELQHLYPRLDQRRSNQEFDVRGCLPAHAASVTSLGITSNAITGSRCTDFCADDVESKENSQTVNMRIRIREKCRELGGAVIRSSDEVDHPKAIYLGTPQMEDSLYFTLEESGYTVMLYPARYPDPDTRELYGGRLAKILAKDLDKDPSLAGKPTEPTRFGEKVLLERQAEYGPMGWLLQFMLLPTLADQDRYPLKLNDISVMDLDVNGEVGPEKVIYSSKPSDSISDLPCVGFSRDWWRRPAELVGKMVPYTSNVMAIDPSGKGADECAYVVAKCLNSQIFVLDVGGFKIGNSESAFRRLAKIARKWNLTKIVVEENYGGGMWSQLFRPFVREIQPGCDVEDIRVSGRKELRQIDILDAPMDSHRIVFSRQAIQNDYDSAQTYSASLAFQLCYQISRLTATSGCLDHDDRLDALALAVAHFSDTMARDYEMEIRLRKEEELDARIDEFEELFSLGPKTHDSWIKRQ